MPKLFSSFSCCWRGAKLLGDSKKTLTVRRVASVENSPQRISLPNFGTTTAPLTPEDLSLSLSGSDLHLFTMEELKAITRGFSASNFIGSGGFGPVYKGSIDDKLRPGLTPQSVAVKLLDLEGSQGHREWLAEVIFLGQLKHPNLVKLIGYSFEEMHRLLVYEYMSKGSLENHLFKNAIASLPWLTRLKIAVGAAKGLAFLHEADKPVIYRDFKASNILLDADYNAKLSDFGLAKDGPEGDETHVTTRVMGTHGYAAPEYILTGHLTAKSDVYSFGVVLLELLTGRCSVDKGRPNREQNLVEWAKHHLFNPQKVDRIMDPSLEGRYSTRGAQKAARIASQCLSHSPKQRPDMKAVVEALEPLLDLRDIPMGPFVYTVVSEESRRVEGKERMQRNEEKKTEGREKGEAKESVKRKMVGHRHKIKFSKSCIYSDTALYKVYRSAPPRKLTPPEK